MAKMMRESEARRSGRLRVASVPADGRRVCIPDSTEIPIRNESCYSSRGPPFQRIWHADGGHAGCCSGLDANVCVLKDEAKFRRYAQALGCEQERVGCGLAALVVL